MTGTVKQDGRIKGVTLVLLVAGALVLSTRSSTLAGGSWGVGGGTDKLVLSGAEEDQDRAVDPDEDRPVRLGGKTGVGPGKSDSSGAV